MRCITLADFLCKRGHEVVFISQFLLEKSQELLHAHGYQVEFLTNSDTVNIFTKENLYENWLPGGWRKDAAEAIEILKRKGTSIDWVIVDHYALDERWEKEIRRMCKHIMVIDDLANRKHCCDLLLDQNFYLEAEARYDQLVSPNTKLLLGPKFALLRSEFARSSNETSPKGMKIEIIMIFYGSTDAKNQTEKTLRAIRKNGMFFRKIIVIVGVSNPHTEDIYKIASQISGCEVYGYLDDMAGMMKQCDLYIGAAGTTTWERCCVGLPSAVITVAQNQEEATQCLDEIGVLTYLGRQEEITEEALATKIKNFIQDPGRLQEMRCKSRELVDGNGCNRCIVEMEMRWKF